MGALLVSAEKRHLPKRLIRKLYQHFNWDPATERKWSQMNNPERERFATGARRLKAEHPQDVKYLTITVRKENVQAHIRTDANKLYNYMIGLLLLDEMARHETATFVPDPRSIRVESGNSLHDYLQTKLWFDLNVATVLTTTPCDSQSSLNVQFADMLSGLVQGHIEDNRSPPWDILSPAIGVKRLFF